MINLQIDWEAQPKLWCGFNRDDFRQLVDRIADFYNIEPNIREKIFVQIGDHFTYHFQDGTKYVPTAFATPVTNAMGTKQVDISLNRSYELINSRLKKYKFDLDFEGYKTQDLYIHLKLEQPQEVVVWFLCEEIHHANYMLNTDSLKDAKSQDFFVETARFHGLEDNIEAYNPNMPNPLKPHYTLDIMEVEASRATVLFLADLFKDTNPKRTELFNEVYQKSLEQRMVINPICKHILETSFVKTGYFP